VIPLQDLYFEPLLSSSKEAPRNMHEKIEKVLHGKEIQEQTFHSFCAQLIKDHADRCRIPSDFKIFEEMDSAIFIYRDIFEDGSVNDKEKAVRERKKEIKKEEERRLSYVAFTRGKEHLFLTLAVRYGGDEREPSEFLADIGYDNWRVGENITVGDLSYFRDSDTKVREMIKDSALEREKAVRKRLLIESLDSGDLKKSPFGAI
jgi:superfamily I DNA/RNA helicase